MRFQLAALACFAAMPVMAQTTLNEEQIKELALEAILENPEIVLQAVQLIEQREQKAQAQTRDQVIRDNLALFTSDDNAPIMGNPDGDVTIVEFFDYNCSYCRKGFEILQEMVEEDPNLKIVFREFPILSEGSVIAAQASLGAMMQGKYVEFHTAMMGDDIQAYTIEENIVMDVAERIGLDLEQLKIDMQSEDVAEHIAVSRELAEAAQFNGTPAFIIGTTPIGGLMGKADLQKLVAQTREAQG